MIKHTHGNFAKGFGVDPLFKHQVPAPWTPLEWANDEARIHCLGRSYAINGMFPDSIISQGKELLAAPIQLQAERGGEILQISGYRRDIVEMVPGLLSIGTECTMGGTKASCQINAEFDGMLRFDIQLDALEPTEFSSLDLVIPMKRELVTLYHHYPVQMIWWEPTDWQINAGALPEDGLKLPFTYHVWLGNDDVGLQWFAESDEGYAPADRSSVITVTPAQDAAVLKINIMSNQMLDGAFRFTFGLMASPVKRFPENYHSWHYNHQAHWSMADHRFSTHPLKDGKPANEDFPSWLDELKSAGARFLGFHEWWSAEQSMARPYYPDRFKSMLEAVHENGMKLIPYTGVYMSEIAPEFNPDWRVGPPEKMYVYDRSAYEDRKPPQRAHITCWNTPYPEILTNQFAGLFKDYGVDGVYTDGLVVPLPCTNMKHGCGYVDADGNIRPTVAIFQAREMMKRFYQICREQNKETLIVSHTSACILLPVLGFSDAYLDGEHLLSKKRAGTSELPLEALRAEMCGHNYGIPCYVLPSDDPLYGRNYTRGIALLHDVIMPWSIADEIDIWKAFTSFGIDGAQWIPYWRSDSVLAYEADKLLISSYLQERRGLLMVAMNLGGSGIVAEVEVDTHFAGIEDVFTARDAVTDEQLRVDGKSVVFGVAPGCFRMIIVD
jgi:hypothetical protein